MQAWPDVPVCLVTHSMRRAHPPLAPCGACGRPGIIRCGNPDCDTLYCNERCRRRDIAKGHTAACGVKLTAV